MTPGADDPDDPDGLDAARGLVAGCAVVAVVWALACGALRLLF